MSTTRRSAVFAAVLTFAGVAAEAGPPLVCWPLSIGDHESLPWKGDAFATDPAYDLRELERDVLRLLGPETPVIVRMETIRRATVYVREDGTHACRLRIALEDRARKSEAAGKPDALAWFDVGYLVCCYGQLGLKADYKPETDAALEAVLGAPGRPWMERALALRGSDPAIEFALALAVFLQDREEAVRRFRSARAGAAEGSLLAANLPLLSPHLKEAASEEGETGR